MDELKPSQIELLLKLLRSSKGSREYMKKNINDYKGTHYQTKETVEGWIFKLDSELFDINDMIDKFSKMVVENEK